MDCPNCGKQNTGDSPLCSSCGWVLCWEKKTQNDKSDGVRVVLLIALFAGIVTFFVGLLVFLPCLWSLVYPGALDEFDFIGIYLFSLAVLSWFLYLPLALIALAMAIVTLFIERNIWLRLLPLVLVLGGNCLFAVSFTF